MLLDKKCCGLKQNAKREISLFLTFSTWHVCMSNRSNEIFSLYGFISIRGCEGDLCIPFRIQTLSGLRYSEVVSSNLTAVSTHICRSCLFLPKWPYDNSNGTCRLGTHKINLYMYTGIAEFLVVTEWQQVKITSCNSWNITVENLFDFF